MKTDPEAAAKRGRALLTYLSEETTRKMLEEDLADPQAFWAALRSKSWVPVLLEAPAAGLPWPWGGPGGPAAAATVAPPKLSRPEGDAWAVSSVMRVVAGDAGPEWLRRCLGWDALPKASVLAAQLRAIAKMHAKIADAADADAPDSSADALRLTLDRELPRLYLAIDQCPSQGIPSERTAACAALLSHGAPCVWVGDGFAQPSEVAFDAPPMYHPFLCAVPPAMLPARALLAELGVRGPVLLVADYAAAIHRMAADAAGEPLSADLLPLAVELIERAAEAPHAAAAAAAAESSLASASASAAHGLSAVMLLPDASGRLFPASELIFNDAAWLASGDGDEGLRLVHDAVSLSAAERLGARSLRFMHVVDKELSADLPCPPAAEIAGALSAASADIKHFLSDLLEVADCLGCTRVDVTLDTRTHGRQSLLQPNLAAFQGPALLVRLRSVDGRPPSESELCALLLPSSPFRLRSRVARFGRGLLGAFFLTDLLQARADPSALPSSPIFYYDPFSPALCHHRLRQISRTHLCCSLPHRRCCLS